MRGGRPLPFLAPPLGSSSSIDNKLSLNCEESEEGMFSIKRGDVIPPLTRTKQKKKVGHVIEDLAFH